MTIPPEKLYDRRLDPFLTAIGLVANRYAELEFAMNHFIWELANVSCSAGVCMTAQMIGPAPRNRCLLSLLKFRQAPDQLLDDFNALGKKIEGLAAQRNRYVHDPLGIDSDTGVVFRMEATADRHLRYDLKTEEIGGLEKLALQIATAIDEFDDLHERAAAELPTWPRIQYAQSVGIRRRRIIRKTDD